MSKKSTNNANRNRIGARTAELRHIPRRDEVGVTTQSPRVRLRSSLERAAKAARDAIAHEQPTGERFTDRFLDVAKVLDAVERMMREATDTDLYKLRVLESTATSTWEVGAQACERAINEFDGWSGEDEPTRVAAVCGTVRAESREHTEWPQSLWKLRIRQLLAEERKVIDFAAWRRNHPERCNAQRAK